MEKQAFQRVPVVSSNIRSIGHSFPRRMLEIEFKDGSVYRYQGVNKNVYKNLLGADSKGKYFHQNIRGQYKYKKYRDQDGSKTGERYHMKNASIQCFDEFVKVANQGGTVGEQIAFKHGDNHVFAPHKKGKKWEPAPPLTKAQKAYMGAALATGGVLLTADMLHRAKKRHELKKKEKALKDAGWIQDK